MTVFVCIDERGGMLFMKRRLSKDRLLTADVINSVGDGVLYISEFSEPLFADSDISVMSVPCPLDCAGDGDYVFVEAEKLKKHVDKIKTLVIYNWNRRYPFDVSIDIEPLSLGFKLAETHEFKGHSHDKITKEIYRK